jgi:stress-induced-phosphoprotein 1
MFGMREYTKAIEALHQAEEHDPEGKHKSEIQQQVFKCQQAMFTQRAGETEEETFNRLMRDPEVAGIMSDPVMQQILQQEKSNPGALQNHMKNPVVRAKILKLIEVGVIQGRWN